jgi:hypothetical protein
MTLSPQDLSSLLRLAAELKLSRLQIGDIIADFNLKAQPLSAQSEKQKALEALQRTRAEFDLWQEQVMSPGDINPIDESVDYGEEETGPIG